MIGFLDSVTINEDAIYTDRELAEILFRNRLKKSSWRTIQKMARNGEIKGVQVGRGGWRFYGSAVQDFLLGR